MLTKINANIDYNTLFTEALMLEFTKRLSCFESSFEFWRQNNVFCHLSWEQKHFTTSKSTGRLSFFFVSTSFYSIAIFSKNQQIDLTISATFWLMRLHCWSSIIIFFCYCRECTKEYRMTISDIDHLESHVKHRRPWIFYMHTNITNIHRNTHTKTHTKSHTHNYLGCLATIFK